MTSNHNRIHLPKKPTTTINFRRRRRKETTISSTTTKFTNSHRHPTVVSPENSSWCCPSAVSSCKPRPQPQPTSASSAVYVSPEPFSGESSVSTETSILLFSNSSVNRDKGNMITNHQETFPSSFTNFNSALTAGLLNPMSPPPPTTADKSRSSPTLFEMMANEPDCKIPNNSNGNVSYINPKKPNNHAIPPPIIVDKQALMQQRLSDLLSCRSPGSQFNDPNSSDVKLTLSSKDGMSVSMNAHRQILVGHSRFFAAKLSEYRFKGGQQSQLQQPYIVEIADCDDIEVYIESIKLMYCKDLRRNLMKEDVPRVLGILKVSAAIGFDAGVLSCLEYLEAAPWAEDEEEKVSSLLSELHIEGSTANEVLKRVSVDGINETNNNEQVLLKLLHTVLEGKDEKARREMKVLVTKMLRENSSHNDLKKESLYSACDKCLILLKKHFLEASNGELQDVAQITRQADNLHFILDILIDRQISEDFLKSWAELTELSQVHNKVPPLYRHEISRVTARLFVGIGKGQLLVCKDLRCLLLQTWLVPFYDDFAWMKRASKGLDRHLIEDGLGNTILTLPLCWQQEILMTWFDRFLNSSDDCPNIQRAFEVWWRRAFWKTGHEQQPERSQQFRGTGENFEKS